MARFALIMLDPPGFEHAGIFAEVIETLQHGLRALGHDAVMARNTCFADCINVLFAAHLLPYFPGFAPPPGTVIFNLEPVIPQMLERLRDYPALLRQPGIAWIWDYDRHNVQALRAMGLPRVAHVPIGHAPEMARIAPAEEDIDVLFYGSLTRRRLAVRDALVQAGLDARFVFKVYGGERDALIARARVVLQLSQFDSGARFDPVRLAWLLGNGRCVLAEGGIDAEQEREFADAVVFADYDELVPECRYLCSMPEERRRVAQAGREWFSTQRRQADLLRPAVAQLLGSLPGY